MTSRSTSLLPRTSRQRLQEEVIHHLTLFGNVTGVLRRGEEGLAYTPFVGRREDVEKLRRVLTGVGKGSDVQPPIFVCGAAGTGKKVFVSWVLHRCMQSGWRTENELAGASANNEGDLGGQPHEHFENEGKGRASATNETVDEHQQIVVIRFVGTTAESSTSSGIMRSICRQIRTAFSDQNSLSVSPALFQPLDNPTTTPNDYSTLCAFFRTTLQLATRDRCIVIILLGLDKLSDPEQGRLGWLPIENMPQSVSLVCTFSTPETTPAVPLLDGLLPRLKNAYKQLLDGRVIMNDALEALANQNGIIVTDSFTLRDASVALRRWLGKEQRKLHPVQRRVILENCIAEDKSVNPLLWKSMVLRASRWSANANDSEEVLASATVSRIGSEGISSDSQVVMDSLFAQLETRHGRQMVCQTCRYICGMRDGISEHELFDLLSTDRSVLSEIYSHLGNGALGKGIGTRPFSVAARIPPVVFADLLSSLIDDWEVLVRFTQGAYEGQSIICFSHGLYEAAAKRRYVTDRELQNTQNVLASYFLFAGNGDEYPISTKQASTEHVIELEDGTSVPLRGLLKRFPPQDVNLAGSHLDFPIYNVRKVRELPNLLIATQRWRELKDLLDDYYFFEALLVTEVTLISFEVVINRN